MEKPFPAYEGDEPYVFVSYSHEDEAAVYKEIRWLQDQRINVWYDEGIRPGSEWSDALAQAIKGCQHLVYFITPRSVASENCRRELNFALGENRHVLAVHLEQTDVPDGIRLSLDNRQAIHRYRITTNAYRQSIRYAMLAEAELIQPVHGGGRETKGTDDRSALTIAVLPFANLTGDPDQEYFSEGITTDIIADLSKFGLFFVISRNSSFSYKGTAVNVKDVARELGVQYVLEGTVQKSGDRIRITSQLIDAIGDKHIWAERYDRKIQDLFELQDEISQSIVAAVAPEYLSAEMKRAQKKETRTLDAWDSFMRGYWHFMRFTKDDIAIAQDLLREAIELDPNQAHYHGLLGVTHTMEVLYGWSRSREESFRKALESAERGLALDDQDAQVIRSAGIVHFFMKNHDTALDYYKRAVQANPNDAESQALLGASLGVAGDYDAALHQFESALLLSPHDLHIATWYQYMGIAAFAVGRDEEAAEWSVKATQSNPQFPGGHRTLASSYGYLGRLKDAAAAREKLQELQPHLTIAQLRESLPYFKNPEDLERYLEGLRKAGLPE